MKPSEFLRDGIVGAVAAMTGTSLFSDLLSDPSVRAAASPVLGALGALIVALIRFWMRKLEKDKGP